MAEVSMTEEASAAEAFAVEPVDWPEVGQFDRLLQRNTEANAEAERRNEA